VSVKAIQNIENMKYDFKIKTLESVIKALNLTVEEFFNLQSFESDREDSSEVLFENLTKLPKDKQGKIISSFNEIVKNIK